MVGSMAGRNMDMVKEAKQEEREASKPGARGMEFRARERVGDEGQPYKHGGAMHRERGGYLPEETEASDKARGQRGGKEKHEAEPSADKKEGMESYADESDAERKHGGAMKKRARGGRLDAAEEHKVHLAHEKKPHHPAHHPRKRGGKVPGKATKARPDRRSRGGSADLNPYTAAGNMSVPDYERQPAIPNGKGSAGMDNKGISGRD